MTSTFMSGTESSICQMYSWMARIVFMASIAGRRARSERWGERTNDDEQQQAKRSSRKRMAQQAHVRLFLWRPRFGFRFFWCAACGCLLWFADRTRHTSATFLSCLARCRCVSGVLAWLRNQIWMWRLLRLLAGVGWMRFGRFWINKPTSMPQTTASTLRSIGHLVRTTPNASSSFLIDAPTSMLLIKTTTRHSIGQLSMATIDASTSFLIDAPTSMLLASTTTRHSIWHLATATINASSSFSPMEPASYSRMYERLSARSSLRHVPPLTIRLMPSASAIALRGLPNGQRLLD